MLIKARILLIVVALAILSVPYSYAFVYGWSWSLTQVLVTLICTVFGILFLKELRDWKVKMVCRGCGEAGYIHLVSRIYPDSHNLGRSHVVKELHCGSCYHVNTASQ